jgi:glycosyltransferase involved in cell wall biosynthesis
MNSPAVSIVITTFNRAPLLRTTLQSFVRQEFKNFEVIIIDDGSDAETPKVCAETWPFPGKYYRMNRDRTLGYNNPARPNNVGIRMAKGDIIILQNAEVKHCGEVIRQMAQLTGSSNAVFAQVEALDEYGMGKSFYVHARHNPRPFFFCGALRREVFERLRGFDEDYQYYGFDDNDFADRLTAAGIAFDFTDIKTQHQWHPTSYNASDRNNQIPALTYARKTAEMKAGKIGIERNLGKEWGQR